jgi:N-acetylneuraminic acid mutarotase
VARGGIAAAVLSGRIFVFGGELPFRIFNATEMYDPATQTWVAKAPMPTPRHGMGAAVVGKRVYIPGGGTRPGPGRTNVLEAYEP